MARLDEIKDFMGRIDESYRSYRMLSEISGTEIPGLKPSEIRNMLGDFDDPELNAAVESEDTEYFQEEVTKVLQKLCGCNNIYGRLSYFFFPDVEKELNSDFNLKYEGCNDSEGHVFDNGNYQLVLYPVDFYEVLGDFRLKNIQVFPSSNGGSVSESRLHRMIKESVKRILKEGYDNMAIGFESPEGGKEVTIYQLDSHNEEGHKRAFQSLDRLKRWGLDFNPSLYKVVYKGTMPVETPDDVYEILQIRHPEGYKGHSLSVGDLVEMDGKVLFCDSFGWTDVTSMFRK